MSTPIQDVRIDHGGAHILMAKQLLDGPNVVPVLKEMSCKRMAECVATRWLGDPGLAGGFFHGLLDDGFLQVVPVLLASRRIGIIL